MPRAAILISAVLPFLAHSAAAAKVSLVVSDEGQARSAGARAGTDVRVLAFDRVRLSDPIEKGRFLAILQSSNRIIAATGGKACGWLGREVEDVSVHCFMPYDGRQVLDFAHVVGWHRIAAVHIAGYERVYAHLSLLARARNIELVGVRVERVRDLIAATPRALKNVQAVWILGDPLLTEGAAFEYLVENTLAQKIPLIAPGAELVARGAFLGAENDPAALTRRSVEAANAAAGGATPEDAVTELAGGRLVVNQVLARRWGVKVPEVAR